LWYNKKFILGVSAYFRIFLTVTRGTIYFFQIG